MRTCLVLPFLFFSVVLLAQFSREKIITACEVCLPTDVFNIDLDGDGDMDVLSASYIDDKIAWYENDGTGRFSEQKIISTQADGARSVYASDLDNDGDIDVLSASFIDDKNKVAWYENDGTGRFSEQKIISTQADGARSVYASDLDNDGDMDVLSASWRDGKIIWYENDGVGRFSEQKIISTQADGAIDVYATDLDGDGDIDVLSASGRDDKIAWYENDGTGSFLEQKIISTQADGAGSVYASDLDGDGDMDVISASYFDDKIAWYENDGAGRFSEQKIISIQADGARSVYASDLDGDGDIDVISASYFDDKIAWYENDGTGRFSEQKIISTQADEVRSVYASDLDGDGDIDVISASERDNKVAWYENDGTGSFLEQKNIISSQADGAWSVYASDLDGDGDMDVISASSRDDKVAWYENDGIGRFSEQKIISTQADGAKSVYAFDIDNDGDIDVLSASFFDDKIAWYENDGAGRFSEEKIISSQADGVWSVYASDLDGDGNMDVIFASRSNFDNKVAWYKNDGIGRFSEEKIISTQTGWAKSVYASDLDGDGDMDVISASGFDFRVAWYENDGAGRFSEEKIISTPANGTENIYASDLDGDGDMDVISNAANNKIVWYENDGIGRFSEQKIISTQADGAKSVYASDLDGDGDIDVISASFFDDKIAWYENLQDYPLSVKVFEDNNYNCTQEANEQGLIREIQIRALPSQTEQVFFTNEDGIIQKQFGATEQDTAIEVRLLDSPNRFNSCPTTFLLKKDEQIDISLPVQLARCPTLSVDIGTPFLRRCFDNVYSVSYCNNSREDISDGYISIQMDSFLNIVQSDLTFEDKGNSLYDFILPTVGAGDCGDFQFTINLSCQATLGQTHCVEAHAYPDSVCTIQSLNDWSGASLRVAGTCKQGEVQFAVTNKGASDMLEKQSLIIVEDMEIIKERELRLAKGITESIFLPANGATYNAYIQQVPNHPGRSAPIAHVEGCGGINTTGLVTAFRKDDGDTFKAIDCQENIGAYDPNDKTAAPVGLESEHYIEKNTRIKYKIRFQNTGTDTAFTVVILDTLPNNLDASTIEVGANSHAFQFDRFQDSIADLNILRFTFDNIMLPDSNINEPASHGFIQFSIDQQADLEDGTIIENKAAIYFDFNEPIITNIAHHTVGLPLIRLTTSTQSLPIEQTAILVYPNPFEDIISIEKKQHLKGAIFSLSDVSGRIIQSLPLVDDLHQISTNQLEAGIYFYKVTSKDGEVIVANGKIVKQ